MLEDLVLRVILLDPGGDERFEQFAVHRFAAERIAVARELLGEGRSSLPRGTRHQVAHHRADQSDWVDAMMGKKTCVFPGEQGIDKTARHFLPTDHDAVFPLQPGIKFAVEIKHHRPLRNRFDRLDIERGRPKTVDQDDQAGGRD
jgi:hypothetical protein